MSTKIDQLAAAKELDRTEGEAALAEVKADIKARATTMVADRLAVLHDIRRIRNENLWVWFIQPDGSTPDGWQPMVHAMFKALYAESRESDEGGWPKDVRNVFIVLLVGEGFSQELAGETFGITKVQVGRILKESATAASGDDGKARAAGEVKTAFEKLSDTILKAQAKFTDRGTWTEAMLVDIESCLLDASAAAGNELKRRDYQAPRSQGQNPRTGTTKQEKVPA